MNSYGDETAAATVRLSWTIWQPGFIFLFFLKKYFCTNMLPHRVAVGLWLLLLGILHMLIGVAPVFTLEGELNPFPPFYKMHFTLFWLVLLVAFVF